MRAEDGWTLAIDVGTTFCVVAARGRSGEPQVVELAGQRRIPSVIVVDEDGTVVVGQAADNLAAAQPARALRAPKNRLGDPSPVVVAGRLFDSAELIAALLRHLHAEAVAQFGGVAPHRCASPTRRAGVGPASSSCVGPLARPASVSPRC